MKLTSIYYLHEIGGKKNQEDYIWPAPGTALPENKIFIVCDGVGGSENGEVASRVIAEYTAKTLAKTAPEKISTGYINQLLAEAKENLIAHARAAGLNKDMATTFSLLLLFSDKAFIAWCGDSRVYHIRNGEVLFKTGDHSLVNTLVKNGEITAQEALVHPQKHIILKAVTGDDTIAEAEGEWRHNLATGDYFMLCTDGLLENITDADLKILLTENITHGADIVPAMQAKCFGKTRDNYSMYLLQVTLQEKPVMPKTKNRHAVAWLLVLTLAALAVLLLFLNKKDAAAVPVPAAVHHDSASEPAGSAVKKDTILQPGKSSVTDSELLNKEEPEENKIVPAPLPETTAADSAAHKKTVPPDAAGADDINRQTHIKNSQPVHKKDSLSKHGQPLN